MTLDLVASSARSLAGSTVVLHLLSAPSTNLESAVEVVALFIAEQTSTENLGFRFGVDPSYLHFCCPPALTITELDPIRQKPGSLPIWIAA